MAGAARWSGGVAASVTLHAAVLGALALALRPQEMPPQDLPPPEIEFAAQEVERVRAREEAPRSEAAARLGADSAPLFQQEVRQSRANAVPETAPRAAPLEPGGPSLHQRATEGARLAEKTQPTARIDPQETTALAAPLPPETPPIQPSPPELRPPRDAIAATLAMTRHRVSTQPLAAAPAPSIDASATERLVAAAYPADRSPIRPEPPRGDRPAPGRIAADRAREADAPAAPAQATSPARLSSDAASLDPPSERATAATAWTGDAASIADPLSLAAIQTFMRPGDIAAAGDATVRDGLSGVLSSVPCARLMTVFDPGTGTLELRGHVPEDGLRAPLLQAVRAQVGTSIPVRDGLLILPRPQCNALAGIAAVGLPQSNDQFTNPRVVGRNTQVREFRYGAGDRLELDLMAPDYDAYLYIDYFDASGAVLHLQPNEIVPLARAAAKSALSAGRPQGGQPFLDLKVGPPFGQEIAVAFATSEPLYEGLRPITEPAAPYLDFLAQRVAAARAEHADFKGEWVYFFIITHAAD